MLPSINLRPPGWRLLSGQHLRHFGHVRLIAQHSIAMNMPTMAKIASVDHGYGGCVLLCCSGVVGSTSVYTILGKVRSKVKSKTIMFVAVRKNSTAEM